MNCELKRLLDREGISYPELTDEDWTIVLPWLMRPEGMLQPVFHQHGPASPECQREILTESRRRMEFILGDLPIERFESVFARTVRNECVKSERDKILMPSEVTEIARLIARIVLKSLKG